MRTKAFFLLPLLTFSSSAFAHGDAGAIYFIGGSVVVLIVAFTLMILQAWRIEKAISLAILLLSLAVDSCLFNYILYAGNEVLTVCISLLNSIVLLVLSTLLWLRSRELARRAHA